MQLIDFLVVASTTGSIGAWAGYAYAVRKMEREALAECERSFVTEYVEKNKQGGCTVHKLPYGAYPEWASSINPIYDGDIDKANEQLYKARNTWHDKTAIAKTDEQAKKTRAYSVGKGDWKC